MAKVNSSVLALAAVLLCCLFTKITASSTITRAVAEPASQVQSIVDRDGAKQG